MSCPANIIKLAESESRSVTIHVKHSLPATLTSSPSIGTNIIMSRSEQGTKHVWTINGNDKGLVLHGLVSVTWTVTYVNKECSVVSSASSAKKACEAISTSARCTTAVYTYRMWSERIFLFHNVGKSQWDKAEVHCKLNFYNKWTIFQTDLTIFQT